MLRSPLRKCILHCRLRREQWLPLAPTNDSAVLTEAAGKTSIHGRSYDERLLIHSAPSQRTTRYPHTAAPPFLPGTWWGRHIHGSCSPPSAVIPVPLPQVLAFPPERRLNWYLTIDYRNEGEPAAPSSSSWIQQLHSLRLPFTPNQASDAKAFHLQRTHHSSSADRRPQVYIVQPCVEASELTHRLMQMKSPNFLLMLAAEEPFSSVEGSVSGQRDFANIPVEMAVERSPLALMPCMKQLHAALQSAALQHWGAASGSPTQHLLWDGVNWVREVDVQLIEAQQGFDKSWFSSDTPSTNRDAAQNSPVISAWLPATWCPKSQQLVHPLSQWDRKGPPAAPPCTRWVFRLRRRWFLCDLSYQGEAARQGHRAGGAGDNNNKSTVLSLQSGRKAFSRVRYRSGTRYFNYNVITGRPIQLNAYLGRKDRWHCSDTTVDSADSALTQHPCPFCCASQSYAFGWIPIPADYVHGNSVAPEDKQKIKMQSFSFYRKTVPLPSFPQLRVPIEHALLSAPSLADPTTSVGTAACNRSSSSPKQTNLAAASPYRAAAVAVPQEQWATGFFFSSPACVLLSQYSWWANSIHSALTQRGGSAPPSSNAMNSLPAVALLSTLQHCGVVPLLQNQSCSTFFSSNNSKDRVYLLGCVPQSPSLYTGDTATPSQCSSDASHPLQWRSVAMDDVTINFVFPLPSLLNQREASPAAATTTTAAAAAASIDDGNGDAASPAIFIELKAALIVLELLESPLDTASSEADADHRSSSFQEHLSSFFFSNRVNIVEVDDDDADDGTAETKGHVSPTSAGKRSCTGEEKTDRDVCITHVHPSITDVVVQLLYYLLTDPQRQPLQWPIATYNNFLSTVYANDAFSSFNNRSDTEQTVEVHEEEGGQTEPQVVKSDTPIAMNKATQFPPKDVKTRYYDETGTRLDDAACVSAPTQSGNAMTHIDHGRDAPAPVIPASCGLLTSDDFYAFPPPPPLGKSSPKASILTPTLGAACASSLIEICSTKQRPPPPMPKRNASNIGVVVPPPSLENERHDGEVDRTEVNPKGDQQTSALPRSPHRHLESFLEADTSHNVLHRIIECEVSEFNRTWSAQWSSDRPKMLQFRLPDHLISAKSKPPPSDSTDDHDIDPLQLFPHLHASAFAACLSPTTANNTTATTPLHVTVDDIGICVLTIKSTDYYINCKNIFYDKQYP